MLFKSRGCFGLDIKGNMFCSWTAGVQMSMFTSHYFVVETQGSGHVLVQKFPGCYFRVMRSESPLTFNLFLPRTFQNKSYRLQVSKGISPPIEMPFVGVNSHEILS